MRNAYRRDWIRPLLLCLGSSSPALHSYIFMMAQKMAVMDKKVYLLIKLIETNEPLENLTLTYAYAELHDSTLTESPQVMIILTASLASSESDSNEEKIQANLQKISKKVKITTDNWRKTVSQEIGAMPIRLRIFIVNEQNRNILLERQESYV